MRKLRKLIGVRDPDLRVIELAREAYRRVQYRRQIGKWPNLTCPSSTTEKILYRKLRGNHRFYAQLADKLAVRDYVAERVGEECLVPVHAVFERLDAQSFNGLPNQFIMKANHGSGWNWIVRDKTQIDQAEIIQFFNSRMDRFYGSMHGERFYRFISPRILVEQLLEVDGASPWGHKFFCHWDGQSFDAMLTVESPCKQSLAHYDNHGQLMGGNVEESVLARVFNPQRYREMWLIARELSRGIDFVRVDLYDYFGKTLFGELTFTPGGGRVEVDDPIRREMRAKLWVLDRDNPRLYRQPAA